MYLGAGTAGTAAVLPEVILLTETDDALCGNAYLVVPDVESLVVVEIDGHPQLVLGQLKHLGAEFPCPRNSFVLEIVAEGEVSEHLEICTVTCGNTDPLDIRSTDALLTGRHAVTRRLDLSRKVFFERGHARIDEQYGLVVDRYERIALMTEMSL